MKSFLIGVLVFVLAVVAPATLLIGGLILAIAYLHENERSPKNASRDPTPPVDQASNVVRMSDRRTSR